MSTMNIPQRLPMWAVRVDAADLVDGKTYFLCRVVGIGHFQLLCKRNNGQQIWGVKPGMAIHAICDGGFRAAVMRSQLHERFAVEIPADHDRRWRRA